MPKSSEEIKKIVTEAWLANPNATYKDIVNITKCGMRTVARYKDKLINEGLLTDPKAGRFGSFRPRKKSPPPKIPDDLAANLTENLITPEKLLELSVSEFLDDIEDEDETRKKLLKQVQKLALDPEVHPDTRLSATQVWVKLKDIARSKDIGPGSPKTREEAVDRLAQIMQAVGVTISLDAIKMAFKKESVNEASPIQTSTTPGASETPNSP